jgi:HEAT repeat protein
VPSRGVLLIVLLAGCGRHRSTGALIERLGSADEAVRIDAATELARRGEEAIPDLIAAMNDERPLVRQWAIWTLGEMGPRAEPAIGRLIEALDDTDDDVRRSATVVLGANLRASSALPSLLQKIKDPAPQVRTASVWALWVMSVHGVSSGAVIPAIANGLHDPDETVRAEAATMLGRFGEEALATLPQILVALDDASPNVRAAAAAAAGAMGPAGRPALDRLVRAFNEDDDHNVRRAATGALAGLGAEAVPALTAALRHRDRFTRVAAAEALGFVEGPAKGALPDLKQAIEEGDPLVVSAAEDAIRRIEGSIAADAAEAREKAEAQVDAGR